MNQISRIIQPDAEKDLVEIVDYLKKQDKDLPLRFFDSFFKQLEHVSALPESGMPFETSNRKLMTLRISPINEFSNYLMFYSYDHINIKIVAIFHGSRNYVPMLINRINKNSIELDTHGAP